MTIGTLGADLQSKQMPSSRKYQDSSISNSYEFSQNGLKDMDDDFSGIADDYEGGGHLKQNLLSPMNKKHVTKKTKKKGKKSLD